MLTLIADCFGRSIMFPLRDDLMEIRGGSLPDNTIYLPYKGVSRHHFSIRKQESKWLLRDLGSKNGTWVHDQRVAAPTVLGDGDLVRFGSLLFTFRFAYAADTTDTQPMSHDQIAAGLAQRAADSDTPKEHPQP